MPGKNVARLGDLHACPFHGGGPIIPAGPPPTVLFENMPAARLGDFALCTPPAPDVLMQGSATVLVNGLPLVGMTDLTAHAGTVVMGAATVVVGPQASSPPSNFDIKGPASFQNKVIRDLFLLSTAKSGKELIARLEKAGKKVVFKPESDPHNSFCAAANLADAKAGKPTGSTVMYNPDVALKGYDAAGNQIDMPPQVVLGHEMVHALNNSEGSHTFGNDPAGPASQPHIEEEEASAIGTGSHNGKSPSENSMRSDLGLARRDNHYGSNAPGPTNNLRPGGY